MNLRVSVPIFARPSRGDAGEPRMTHYPDTGCLNSPSCLTCPLPDCAPKWDRPKAKPKSARAKRTRPGLDSLGRKRGGADAKLSRAQVMEIRARRQAGESYVSLQQRFKVGFNCISDAETGRGAYRDML